MKMADLVFANPRLLLVFSRFNMGLGFGDHSVREVCEYNKVPTGFFLLICNVYSNEDFVPTADDLNTVDMNEMVSYLMTSHTYYLEERFPHIESHLNKIVEAIIPKYGNTIKRFFDEYKNEVVNHFNYEEKIVFPYLRSLVSGCKSLPYNISQFRENHSNIEDKLSDLMNILVKYMPADAFQKERIEISLDIMELSSDLACHTMIENRVLVPYVETIERQ